MFDNPKKMVQKNIGILDFDKDLLEKLNVGKKPHSLPPIQQQQSTDKSPATTQKTKRQTYSRPVSSPRRLGNTNSNINTNSSPRENIYLDALIKENAKNNRQNDFDALCKQLVQQTEDERRLRKQSRPETPQYQRGAPVNRKNTFRVSEDSLSDTEENVKTSHVEQQRPTTSSNNRPKTGYGRRRAHAQDL